MARYKLILAYDGTNYCGWQVQKSATSKKFSIQALVQNALEKALRHPISLTGSGRTDAGVHAKGQVAHFNTETPIDLSKLRLSLNGLLPLDIRVFEIVSVPETFHARYSASSKIYHYFLHLDRIADPFTQKFRLHIFKKLNLSLLEKAALEFLGVHDFTSFTNEPQRGAVAYDPVRHLKRLDIHPIDGGVRLEFEADGFLYKMVRNITGTLIECASGRTDISEIKKIFQAQDRKKAHATVAPHGLFLIKVTYPQAALAIQHEKPLELKLQAKEDVLMSRLK